MKSSFEIAERPEMLVAYIEHVGPYQGIGEAFGRLMAWAGRRGLLARPDITVLGVYLCDPETTAPADLRSRACLVVPEGTAGEDEVATMVVPGGTFAVGHFEMAEDEYGRAWQAVMEEFLPTTGYVPDERMCYEVYLNDPSSHPQGLHVVDICEPVRQA